MKPAFSLLLLGLPLVLTGLLSCMKAKAKTEDLGPEVPASQIDASIARMQDAASVNAIAVGQSLSFSTVRRIENMDSTTVLGGQKIEVIDRQDVGAQSDFTLRITTATRQPDGNFETIVSQDSLWVNKPGAGVATALST